MSKKTGQIKFMQAMFPNAKFVECKYIEEGYELKNNDNFNISEENVKSDNISLTEQWKRGELEEKHYYLKDNEYIFIDYFNGVSFKETCDFEIKEVLAPVPSYKGWQQMKAFCEEFNALEVAEENQKLREKLEPFTDAYFKGLTTKDISELAKKSIRLTKQSCEDNTIIQRLKELLGYCADILEELDDKDRDIEILLEEVNEVLA